jgi:hypothetical protein
VEPKLDSSRDGPPTCRLGEIHLHSPYDPVREAERFLESRLGASRPTCVVLLGPCLDYLSPLLRRRLPLATILSVQYSSFFEGRGFGVPDRIWHPGLVQDLESFLRSSIDEDEVSGIAALSWEPASRAFPAEASMAAAALRSCLDRLASSAATVRVFGRRWILNACRSFLLVERLAEGGKTERPVVVASAGPSLGEALEELAPLRSRYALVAVSSALAACEARGLEPDLVVATDGGAWSRLHLYPLAAAMRDLAAPLTALPSSSLASRYALLVLDQGGFVESELAPGLGASLRVPPHGTVSGTALRLASALSSGPIAAAGLDLAVQDCREHAWPHGFDAVNSAGEDRFRPLESSSFSRALEAAPIALEGLWRRSRSLEIYASALAADARSLPSAPIRLGNSPVDLPGFVHLAAREAFGDRRTGREAAASSAASSAAPSAAWAPRGGKGHPSPSLIAARRDAPPLEARRTFLGERLSSWRALVRASARTLSDGVLPGEERTREFLRSIDLPDWAAARRAILGGGDPKPAASELARRCIAFLDELELRTLG